MGEKMLLGDGEERLVIFEQFDTDRKLCPLANECFAIKDREIYHEVCFSNSSSCRNFLKDKPVSKEDYESGNYAIEFFKGGKMSVLSGGKK